MSFTYGGTSTADIAGVTATLLEWPSLGGISIENETIPGRHGRHYNGVTRAASRFVFDVIIAGSTPQETGERRDNFVGLVDPARGPLSMELEADTGWVWDDVLISEEVNWERVTWDYGLGFQLRAEVTFETQGEPGARKADPQVVTFAGTESITLDTGNTSTQPRMVITPLSEEDELTVTVGSFEMTVERFSSWTGDHRLVLDWDQMEFYLLNEDGDRIASAVPAMSRYDWPTLNPGDTVTVGVSPSRPVEFYPNARRI